MLDDILSSITLNKLGVEIGGPSGSGDIIYKMQNLLITSFFPKILFGVII